MFNLIRKAVSHVANFLGTSQPDEASPTPLISTSAGRPQLPPLATRESTSDRRSKAQAILELRRKLLRAVSRSKAATKKSSNTDYADAQRRRAMLNNIIKQLNRYIAKNKSFETLQKLNFMLDIAYAKDRKISLHEIAYILRYVLGVEVPLAGPVPKKQPKGSRSASQNRSGTPMHKPEALGKSPLSRCRLPPATPEPELQDAASTSSLPDRETSSPAPEAMFVFVGVQAPATIHISNSTVPARVPASNSSSGTAISSTSTGLKTLTPAVANTSAFRIPSPQKRARPPFVRSQSPSPPPRSRQPTSRPARSMRPTRPTAPAVRLPVPMAVPAAAIAARKRKVYENDASIPSKRPRS